MEWEIFTLNPRRSSEDISTATLKAAGPIWSINQQTVSTAVQAGNTGELIEAVLDAAGWDQSRRDIDIGILVFTTWFSTDQIPLQTIRQLEEVDSGFFRESNTGDLVYENRLSRRRRSRSTNIQARFGQGEDISILNRRD